jgi:methionyl-tRNA synthetase
VNIHRPIIFVILFSISRTSFKWGIKVPGEKNHIIYVWFDALINYLTAINYPKKNYKNYWPVNIHLMGKEIIRFHCVTWPAMLLSAGLKLPKKIFAHGWWTINAKKMSKTIGNVVYPDKLCEKYKVPIDCIRYTLFKQMPFGNDGDFSEEAFVERVNNELADLLGNLISRSMTLFKKYSNSKVPKGKKDNEIIKEQKKALEDYHERMNNLDYYSALSTIFEFIQILNKYISDKEPWKLIKKDKKELNNVLYNIAQAINSISCLIYPFMPETSEKIDSKLGTKKDYNTKFNNVKVGTKTKKEKILFPKIELIKKKEKKKEIQEFINFEDFKKLNMRVGTIKEVSKLTDKLYKIIVKADKERTIVSGIRKYYFFAD